MKASTLLAATVIMDDDADRKTVSLAVAFAREVSRNAKDKTAPSLTVPG